MVFPFPHPFLGHVSCVPFVHISSFHCFPSLLFLFHPTPPPFLILRAFPSICSFLSFPFPLSTPIRISLQITFISMFNCNAHQTPSKTQSHRKMTCKAGLLVLAVLVINTTVILPIQHGCEIPKSAVILSETCIGNAACHSITNLSYNLFLVK